MSPMRCATWELLVCGGMPAVDPRLRDVIASLPSPNAEHTRTPHSRGAPMNHERSRLQGKAGKAIDIVTLSRLLEARPRAMHPRLSNRLQVLVLACSGATVHDERSGWLQDHQFSASAFSTGSACPESRTGSICALVPQTGAHKGQLCGMPLDSFGRHSHGACSEQQAHGHVCTMRSATVLPICAAKRV